jgi:hypothetical protein
VWNKHHEKIWSSNVSAARKILLAIALLFAASAVTAQVLSQVNPTLLPSVLGTLDVQVLTFSAAGVSLIAIAFAALLGARGGSEAAAQSKTDKKQAKADKKQAQVDAKKAKAEAAAQAKADKKNQKAVPEIVPAVADVEDWASAVTAPPAAENLKLTPAEKREAREQAKADKARAKTEAAFQKQAPLAAN